MATPQTLEWMEPLELASRVTDPFRVLLYSGAQTGYSGRYSYLACDLAEHVKGDDFSVFEPATDANFGHAWFGYLGYGLKDSVETLRPDEPNRLALPHLCMMRFHTVYRFDHHARTLVRWGKEPRLKPLAQESDSLPDTVSLMSNMTRREYLEKAAHIIERIHAGDLYQANLTRKFMGEFETTPEPFALFRRLCNVSPAPYSAFLALGDTQILSSSPELFLQVDAEGRVRTRPIKGTAPRFADAAQDKASRDALAVSAKDRAENLMIVDLMRNDLSRGCALSSLAVENLFEVSSHTAIHHLSSTVTGQKRPDCSTLELVKGCFPPGSMTGAPKISAMNLCSELERQARGVYGGAIGWFSGDGSCELSVVIRTLILKGNRFEFQVGGGIVADSTPEKEFQETMDKSRGMLAALGLSINQLERL